MPKTASEQKAQERFIVMPGINQFSERLRIAMNNMPNIELARKAACLNQPYVAILKAVVFQA